MSPAFDYHGTLKRFGQDERLFSEMVGFFYDDSPKWIEMIRTGLSKADVTMIHRGAHTLKGMVANFGASRAMAAAAQIEQHAGMNNLLAVERSLPLLEDALDELERAFAEHGLTQSAHNSDPSMDTASADR